MPCKPLYRSTHALYSHNFALEGAIFALEAPYLLFALLLMYDALAEMLESIEHFINRLRIYAATSHAMPAVDEIVVKLMVELISTLALVTQKLEK